MIEKIKDDMEGHLGETIKIIFNAGRNRHEKYDATLMELYNFIFVVKLNNDLNEVRSFTYSDILTQTIEIYYE